MDYPHDHVDHYDGPKVYAVGWAWIDDEVGGPPPYPGFDVLAAYLHREDAEAYAEAKRLVEHAKLVEAEGPGDLHAGGPCDCGPEVLAVPYFTDASAPESIRGEEPVLPPAPRALVN